MTGIYGSLEPANHSLQDGEMRGITISVADLEATKNMTREDAIKWLHEKYQIPLGLNYMNVEQFEGGADITFTHKKN